MRAPRWLVARHGEPGRRLAVGLLAITFVLTLFGARLIQLQGMESGKYKQLAAQERLDNITLYAMRGTITGADGQVLAMTIEKFTVTADPPQIRGTAAKRAVAAQLAAPLGMPAPAILGLLEHPTSTQYVLLKAGVSTQDGTRIQAMNLTGIYLTPTFTEVYPDGDATANVVGFTNVSSKGAITGQAGIELADNSLLAGRNGSEQVEIGTDYVPIPLQGSKDTPAVDGTGIRLTIIPALQLAAQQACETRVKQEHARDCTVVIMRPKTGDILAMAQWPTYSQATLSNVANATDLPVQDVFEPGSTAKVITAAAAFEHGGKTPMSSYYIPFAIYRGGQWIHDAENDAGAHYTIAGIIANSSNIGMAQVADSISPQTQYDYLRAFGLDEPTGLNLPGASRGLLAPPSAWAPDEHYTLAYGQGIAVNAVQMASVYATLANGGVRVQPRLIAGTVSPSGKYTPAPPSPARRVVKASTARNLVTILQQVPGVDESAGEPWGIIPGYAIASKTGTSNESSPKCPGQLCEYGSSYIGMAPGNDPQVVVAVNVQHPDAKFGYYGDVVAGPVFYSVMKFALQTLRIPPDGATVPHVPLNAPW